MSDEKKDKEEIINMIIEELVIYDKNAFSDRETAIKILNDIYHCRLKPEFEDMSREELINYIIKKLKELRMGRK